MRKCTGTINLTLGAQRREGIPLPEETGLRVRLPLQDIWDTFSRIRKNLRKAV
jgi:hypothetical protein